MVFFIKYFVFDEITKEYPTTVHEYYIVDIDTARIAAATPEIFDVVVTSNLFGDIISDITGEISGSVEFGGFCKC